MSKKITEFFSTPVTKSSFPSTETTPEEPATRVRSTPAPDTSHLFEKEPEYSLPEFILPENIKDSQGRRPDHPDYDPTTLLLPAKLVCTPARKQYWQFKAENYDKIVLFKMGKFYEVFYEDAILCQKIFNLNWVGDPKNCHVGFPEKTMERYASELVSQGYSVVIVEQTETPHSAKNKVLERAISEVFTKGTYIDRTAGDTNYLLVLHEFYGEFGFCVLDCSTSKFLVGSCNFEELKTLFIQVRPVEVVFNPNLLGDPCKKLISQMPVPPVQSQLRSADIWKGINIARYFQHGLPPELRNVHELGITALCACFHYLQQILQYEKVISSASYMEYYPHCIDNSAMVLNSKTLERLEIFEARVGGKLQIDGSLFKFIDRTSSKYGSRLLKRWICAPLLQVQSINKRLDAVEELTSRPELLDCIQSVIKATPDLERQLDAICKNSLKLNSQAVYFEDISTSSIKELSHLQASFISIQELMEYLHVQGLQSEKLLEIIELQEYAQIRPFCEDLMSRVTIGADNVPTPKPGLSQEYDNALAEVNRIKNTLGEYLEQQRSLHFRNHPDVQYSHTKYRYEIEVPSSLISGKKSRPPNYEYSSSKKGYERFTTKETKVLAEELDNAEDLLNFALRHVIGDILGEFYQNKTVWQRVLTAISELDCLCAFATVITRSGINMVRPSFITNSKKHFSASGLMHPILACKNPAFVPNDVSFNDEISAIILTGPNMGGKSTILRQVGLSVIMAQIGCYVPATEFSLSPVDAIFTRLGAGDNLIEGKSTFLLELEEQAEINRCATESSLAIIDELGRGTSTFDGAAIAYACLEELLNNKAPRMIFTTHYHMLTDKISTLNRVKMGYMDYYLDELSGVITFLYKLVPGICRGSFGLEVCQMIGMSPSFIGRARSKAEEMRRELENRLGNLAERFTN